MLIATAPLVGNQFDLDNKRVYGIIKQLILEGPARAYITSVVDQSIYGRAALLALRGHYEGESFLNKQKEETYKAIEAVHYKGEQTTFTFEHLSGILTKSYNDLQRYGEPVLEAKKVRDLLTKITDPKLESAKLAVKSKPNYKNSFDMVINFLAESVETLGSSKPRMIGETHTHGHGRGNNYQSGRAPGRSARGCGSGGHQGRGGCGHGGHGRGGRGRGRAVEVTITHRSTYHLPSGKQ
jgi:hypothetical protein